MSDIIPLNNKLTYYCVYYDYVNNNKNIREFSIPVLYKSHYIDHDFGFGLGEQCINYDVEINLTSIEFDSFLNKYNIDLDSFNEWLNTAIHHLYAHALENTIKI